MVEMKEKGYGMRAVVSRPDDYPASLMTEEGFDTAMDNLFHKVLEKGDSLCIRLDKTGLATIGFMKPSTSTLQVSFRTNNCLAFGPDFSYTNRCDKLVELIILYSRKIDAVDRKMIMGEKSGAQAFLEKHGVSVEENENPYDRIEELEIVIRK